MSDPILAYVSQRQAQVDRPADGVQSHMIMTRSICSGVNARTSPGSDRWKPARLLWLRSEGYRGTDDLGQRR
ncbi:hypothetical protein Y032_0681g1481 [Ancylostoma ceylanicum]|uniref:Uncharacterized protein n=1 Tax=Ancylostoma ceylanicum TaxID=53326 RepID=A0A016WHB3_9BILA|nr:hypothetical protein Y032_0681g1481 [Ancylostoma ceylanicum]